MWKFLGARLLQALCTLWMGSVVVFFSARLTGSPDLALFPQIVIIPDQQPVKRIMVEGKVPEGVVMGQLNGEDGQVIGDLLSPDHVVKGDIELEAVDLVLGLDRPGADHASDGCNRPADPCECNRNIMPPLLRAVRCRALAPSAPAFL